MTDEQKTKQELIQELDILRQRVADLKQSELAGKRAEEALRETEEKYRAVFENTGAATVVVEENSIISLANAEFVRLSGYSLGEVEGKKSWTEFVVKEDLERMQAQHRLRRQNAEKALRHYEFRFVRRNGDIRNIYLSIDVILGTTKSVASLLDITERRRAEEALNTEKQRFQTLSEQAPFGMVMIDQNGTFRYINPKFRELFGYELTDVPDGKTWVRKAYPDAAYRHHVIGTWVKELEAFKPGEKRPEVFTVTCKDGTEKLINFIPVQLATGENLMACENITERRQAEEALQRSEEAATRLARENALIAEIGRIVSSTLNIDEVYERFAKEAWKLIPFDRININTFNHEEKTATAAFSAGTAVAGRQVGTVFPLAGSGAEEVMRTRMGLLLHPEDKAGLERRFPGLLPSFQAGHRSMIIVPLISKNDVIGSIYFGSTQPKSFTERHLKLAGNIGSQIAGAIANGQLYNEWKRTEEALRKGEKKFRELYDNAPVGYHEYDTEGRITNVNCTDLEMLGYSPQEMIGQYVWKFNIEEDLARQQILEKLAGLRPPARSIERTYRRKDGRTFPVLCEDRLSVDEQGRITGIRCIIQDITKRKRLEEERENLIKELREALSKVKQLSGMLPICSSCKKIRDDKGYWNQIEVYVYDHSEAEFTHGICPDCFKKLYPNEPLEDL